MGRGQLGKFIPLILFVVATTASARAADPLPDSPNCADFRSNSTGAVDEACNAAIAQESDPRMKSVLLLRRAFVEDATHDFSKYDGALADLSEALKLYPDNYGALHERAYLYNELGRWQDAERDIDRQIALLPSAPQGYQERSLSRFQLGDLEGSYEDHDMAARLQPNDAGAIVARARSELWLGRFDAVKQDIVLGEQIAKVSGDQSTIDFANAVSKQLDAWLRTSGSASATQTCLTAKTDADYSRPGIIGDCSRAFLDATTPSERAAALTGRSLAWLIGAHDEGEALTDAQIAVALDPGNASWHSNLGFAYIRGRHSKAAEGEFEKAIALAPSFVSYAGRASARYNIGDFDGAFADANRSFQLKPNDIALTILGDISFERLKDPKAAKKYWLSAYNLGDRDDGLKARLSKVDVNWPPPNDALPDNPVAH